MTLKLPPLIVVLLWHVLTASAWGMHLTLDEGQGSYSLAPYLELLEDVDGTLTLEQVTAPERSHLFFQTHRSSPNIGFTDSAYWIRFRVNNPAPHPLVWFLELDYPTMNYLDLYVPDLQGGFERRSTGDQHPFSKREIEYRNFLFKLTIPPGITQTYYLRVQSTAISVPLFLWQATSLNKKILIEYCLLGFYFGGLVVIAVFNLFIFTSVRERVYLYYVLYTLGFALTESALNGLAFQFLWSNQVWWANRALVVSGSFCMLWALQFTRTFIDTPVYVPRLDKVLLVGMALSAVAGVVCLVDYSLGNRLMSMSMLIMAPIIICSGLICLKKGSFTARYYTLAWLLVLFGVSIHVLKTFGFLPTNMITNWGDELGSLAEVSLLSFGLAARINLMKRTEKDRALELQRKNMELEEKNRMLKDYERTLEQKITDRTLELNLKNKMLNEALENVKSSNRELKTAKEKAETADRAKSEFLSNISHELRTPMQGILGFAKLGVERINSVKKEKLVTYFSTIQSSGERLLTLINDLLDLSRLEAGKESFDFRDAKLSQLTALVLSELTPLTEAKQTRVDLLTPEDEATAQLDHSKIMQVIRNFISNAIKFSPTNSQIRVEITNHPHSLLFSITDQGVGIPDEELHTIFGKFFQSSRTKNNAGGTGLGLAICKKIIMDHQGEIWAENNPQGGSVFHFRIPRLQPRATPLPSESIF